MTSTFDVSLDASERVVDLTTLGATVTPALLFAHPDYVACPEMPEGEPDHHELVAMVRTLEQRLVALERMNAEGA
jgi:hypothetical protein